MTSAENNKRCKRFEQTVEEMLLYLEFAAERHGFGDDQRYLDLRKSLDETLLAYKKE